MLELKYARIQEHVIRLQNDLARPRINISDASARYVCLPLIPSILYLPHRNKRFHSFILVTWNITDWI